MNSFLQVMTGLLVALEASSAAPAMPDAREIVAAYAREQDKIRGFTVHFREERFGELWAPHLEYAQAYVPGRRHEFTKGWFSQDLAQGRSIIRAYDWHAPDPPHPPIPEHKAIYSIRRWQACEYIQFASPNPFNVILRAPEGTRPYRENPVCLLALEFPGREAMGYILEDSLRLDAQLVGANLLLRQEQERIGTSRCHTVYAATRFGRITAWFDPQRQYALAKCVAELTGEHLFQGKPLSRAASKPGVAYRVDMTVIAFTQVSGKWLPAKVRVLERYTFPHGDYCTKSRIVELDSWFINPNFEAIGAFELTDVPDDSLWRIDLQTQNYLWNGGNLIRTHLSDLGYRPTHQPPAWVPRSRPR